MNKPVSKIILTSLIFIAGLCPISTKTVTPDAFDKVVISLAYAGTWAASQAVGVGWFINAPKTKKNVCKAAAPTLTVAAAAAVGGLYLQLK